MLPVRAGLCACLKLSLLAIVSASAGAAAYPQKSDSCLDSSAVQKLVAEGLDANRPYVQRKNAYQEAIRQCPGQRTLYHLIAVLALQNHDFSDQLRWARSGLNLWPDDPQLQLDEAIALVSGGHMEDSLPVLTRLPPSAESEFYLGMAERALGDHKAAQAALSKAFDLGFPDPYVLYVLIEQDRDLRDKEAGLRDFQILAKRFPNSGWLHVVLGDAYMSRYEDSSAQSEYRQALEIDPRLPIIHFQLGILAFSHDNRSLAADEFRKEIDVDPAFGDAYLYLGLIQRREGNSQEALPLLERAVALEPSSPLPYRALAVAQINLNLTDAASATLREAKRRFPSEPAFAAQLAVLLKQMGRPAEAQEESALAETLSRKANPPLQPAGEVVAREEKSSVRVPVRANAATSAALLAPPEPDGASPQADPEKSLSQSSATVFDELKGCLEREDSACAASALAAIRDPSILGTGDYLELKAQALGLLQRKPEALAAVQAAIERNPGQPHFLITEGRICLRFGQPVDAITSFLKAAKLEPDSPAPLYFLGTSFFLLAQRTHSPDYYSRAVNHFKLALQASPDYHRAEFMLGVIDAVQSRLDDAKNHLQRAIQLDPSNPYYHLHYGILLKHEGDDHGALGELKTAEELNSSYALTYFELGTVYERLGQYGEARSQLQAALKLNPGLSTPYYHLGAVYAHLGNATESKAAYAKFNLMKEQTEQPSSDPAASAIADEDRDR
ncbi:MAG TPA: tetratricopeptide repeat protein [Terriglobia bacterium]|nr:tetratricopeptide repeat protein [Terriglobia bacterium]